jgi:hypothetical protein
LIVNSPQPRGRSESIYQCSGHLHPLLSLSFPGDQTTLSLWSLHSLPWISLSWGPFSAPLGFSSGLISQTLRRNSSEHPTAKLSTLGCGDQVPALLAWFYHLL